MSDTAEWGALKAALERLENRLIGLQQLTEPTFQNSAAALNAHNGLGNVLNGLENQIIGAGQIAAQTLAQISQFATPGPADAAAIALMARATLARAAKTANPPPPVAPIVAPAAVDLGADLARLAAAAPRNFAMWKQRFDAGAAAYEAADPADLSTPGNYSAVLFGLFVECHARGRVLDLGVGPLPAPVYLSAIPYGQIAAIDPLDPVGAHPFVFARAAAEYLPWPDGSFETIVAATSIDHVYLLDRALAECKRVLAPGGRLLLWTGIFPHTPAYDPYTDEITAPDAYHLFHPGENWFPAMVANQFRLIERLDVTRIGFANAFLAYAKP
jgi:SAM-dependent methyltransferase